VVDALRVGGEELVARVVVEAGGDGRVRTTSMSRGSSITATSDPPTKSTRPWHDVKVSLTR
jgi:hypothetical protein